MPKPQTPGPERSGPPSKTRPNPALRFAVREIREQEGLTFSGPVAVEDVAAPEAFGEARPQGPCRVEIEFSVGGSRILMEGRVEGVWRLPCNRCLAPHPVTLSAGLEETYPLTQESIDLTEEVRQALLLSLPQRSLCRPECKGLCARCGADFNEGPCRCS